MRPRFTSLEHDWASRKEKALHGSKSERLIIYLDESGVSLSTEAIMDRGIENLLKGLIGPY
jgi:hypothetical protein